MARPEGQQVGPLHGAAELGDPDGEGHALAALEDREVVDAGDLRRRVAVGGDGAVREHGQPGSGDRVVAEAERGGHDPVELRRDAQLVAVLTEDGERAVAQVAGPAPLEVDVEGAGQRSQGPDEVERGPRVGALPDAQAHVRCPARHCCDVAAIGMMCSGQAGRRLVGPLLQGRVVLPRQGNSEAVVGRRLAEVERDPGGSAELGAGQGAPGDDLGRMGAQARAPGETDGGWHGIDLEQMPPTSRRRGKAADPGTADATRWLHPPRLTRLRGLCPPAVSASPSVNCCDAPPPAPRERWGCPARRGRQDRRPGRPSARSSSAPWRCGSWAARRPRSPPRVSAPCPSPR